MSQCHKYNGLIPGSKRKGNNDSKSYFVEVVLIPSVFNANYHLLQNVQTLINVNSNCYFLENVFSLS